MIIGDRLRELREERKLSQAQIEDRSGILRCYISRIENGHTVPSVETLEKIMRALEVPLYQLFYRGDGPPELLNPTNGKAIGVVWGSRGKDARYLHKLVRCLSKTTDMDKKLIMEMARQMARRDVP